MSSKIPVAISFTGVANFLGVVGIIGSLVFVALELRQSQKIALAAQQQARTEVFTNVVNSVNQASSVSLYQILSKVMANEVLTSQEKKIAENYAFQTVWIFENDFIQYKAGLIDEDVWSAKLFSMRTVAGLCHLRDSVEYLFQFMTPEISNLIDIKPRSQCT